MKKIFKKLMLILSLTAFTLTSFTNCFGKFGLVRKLYQINDTVVSGGMVAKIVKTIVMYIFYIPYGIAFVLDVLVFNLVEFWTDKNPMGFNEYNKEGIYVKEFQRGEESVRLTYVNFGSRLNVDIKSGANSSSVVLLRSEPGVIYQEINGKLEPIQFESKEFGSKMLIKVLKSGHLDSSKIIDVKDYNDLEKRYIY